MAFTFAGTIIDALKKNLGIDENTYAIIQVWEKEMQPLLHNAALVAVKKNVLIVEVASSAHFQELTLRRHEIIRKMNQYFGGKKAVKDIKIQLKK